MCFNWKTAAAVKQGTAPRPSDSQNRPAHGILSLRGAAGADAPSSSCREGGSRIPGARAAGPAGSSFRRCSAGGPTCRQLDINGPRGAAAAPKGHGGSVKVSGASWSPRPGEKGQCPEGSVLAGQRQGCRARHRADQSPAWWPLSLPGLWLCR